MTVDRKKTAGAGSKESRSGNVARSSEPGWANGLKQLYNEVVEEDIPDSFKDLLSKLDDKN